MIEDYNLGDRSKLYLKLHEAVVFTFKSLESCAVRQQGYKLLQKEASSKQGSTWLRLGGWGYISDLIYKDQGTKEVSIEPRTGLTD